MKKLILTALLIVSAVSLKAQSPAGYYPGDSGTVKGYGYTYKYSDKNHPGYTTLYNSENRLTGVEWAMKDGSLIPNGIGLGDVYTYEDDDWTCPKAHSIVQNAFNSLSNAERKLLNGEVLLISTKIDSSTGKVIEVEIYFFDDSPFQNVPIEIFRKIELDLKSGIWFVVTPEGKKLNYCILSWDQDYKYVFMPPIPDVPTPPTEPTPPSDPPKGPIKKPNAPWEF